MVKIGVFADTHIGRCVPRAISELRRSAYRHAFVQAINIFLDEGIDYVVHAGDMFEKRSMTPEDSVFVKEEFQRLVDSIRKRYGKDVTIFTIRGNHDGAPSSNALDYIRHPLAEYLKVIGDDIQGDTQLLEDLCLIGIAYHPYIARIFCDLKPIIKEKFRCGGKKPKILMLHNFVEGYHQIPPGVPRHSLLTIGDLKGIGADIIVAGHYHKRLEPMNENGMVLLTPGATEAVDLSDEGPYGFYILEKKEFRFVEIKPLHEIRNLRVDSKGSVKPTSWFIERTLRGIRDYALSLQERSVEGVMRIILLGLTDEDQYNMEHRLFQEISKLNERSSKLLYVDLINRVEDVRQPISIPAFGGGVELAAKIIESIGDLAPDAMKIVDEVSIALDERASQKTGLLTGSDRASFVTRWIEIIDKME
ncbi:MAG: metallophosphoesterase family protein [Thermoproteota archaeon]